MDSNTMQLAVITSEELEEVETAELTRQRWQLFSPRPPKKHRVKDYIARLKGDLKRSEDLNEELGGMLRDALEKNVNLTEQVAELTEQLRVAEEANRVNALGVDFHFAERQVDGPADQATMPVPQVELLTDGPSVKAAAANAATALLERVAVQAVETKMLPAVTAVPALTPVHGNATLDPWGIQGTDEEPEIFNETGNGWQVRPPVVSFPVTWGRSQPARELQADQSVTGTFRVMSLQARGTTPTSIPGLTAL